MINNTNESKISKGKKEEALINRSLAINFTLKVIQVFMFSINTYKQYMIPVGNENGKIKNKDIWNYCHHIPMLPLLEDNRRLPLVHMDKCVIRIEEIGERIIEFDIRYMINPSFYVNKSFKEQVGNV